MYKEFGWTEKNMDSTEYIYPVLKELLRGKKRGHILDMGCGNGDIANRLIAEGFSVYGVDASEEGIAVANRTNPGHFFVADLQDGTVPKVIEDKVFDTVISTEVIEHMYSPEMYMKFIEKVLKEEGQLYLTTPYHGYLKNLVIAVLGKTDSHVNPLFEGGHIKFFSLKTIKLLLEKNHYDFVRFVGCGRIPYLWKSMLIEAKRKG